MRYFGKFMIVIVLNIFLMLVVSVMLEYNNLSERHQQLENNISTSFRMALDGSIASEELFSGEYQSGISSYGIAYSDSASLTNSSVTLYRDGTWYTGNTYVIAKFYEDYGRFPNTEIEYTSYAFSFGTKAIYEWMFGNIGQSYTNSSLSWANKSTSVANSLSGLSTSRTPTSTFANYYKSIGNKIKTKGNVKIKSGSSDFTVGQAEYSLLDNMGLDFSSVYSSSYTSVNSSYMTDNFCMSGHIGKSVVSGGSTQYYLTPFSLGVTYVPVEVLKPTFLANLDTLVRLQKIGGGNIEQMSEAAIFASFDGADGCVPTSVYENSTTSTNHISSSSSIINDGLVEYDLDTVSVKVDYFVVDFYDEANKDIVSEILGSLGGFNFDGSHIGLSQQEILKSTVNSLKASDTGKYGINYVNGNRVVAKATVRMKCYIPYQSSIMQWLCRRDWDGTSDNHYSIRMWEPSSGEVVRSEDGVWFQYSTYVGISR